MRKWLLRIVAPLLGVLTYLYLFLIWAAMLGPPAAEPDALDAYWRVVGYGFLAVSAMWALFALAVRLTRPRHLTATNQS